MEPLATQYLGQSPADLALAATLLGQGGLVAIPTETVYGLAADATNDAAVAAIYAAKGRPSFNPLIIHVSDIEMAETYARFSDAARDLARTFWPGPLTLVLPVAPDSSLSPRVTAGLNSVAIRLPATRTARAIIAGLGRPLAAPSANPSGKISPTSATHVRAGLDGKIAAVVDAGACDIGLESTILGFEDGVQLLRPGGLPAEAIEAHLGHPLARPQLDHAAPNAPGQLLSHYAPNAHVRLNATTARSDEAHLGFGEIAGDDTLSASGDLEEAAANLFAKLRELDRKGLRGIAVAPIPDHGLGVAINDRLRRAAAPRGS